MTDMVLTYEMEETGDGWFFRQDEALPWQGPFPTQEAANAAALKFIESLLTYHAGEMLGLSN
ncbi:hypothetical protein [Agrobacterium sp. CG674]